MGIWAGRAAKVQETHRNAANRGTVEAVEITENVAPTRINAAAGESRRMPLSRIADVKETWALHLKGAMPIFVPAVQLVLTSAQVRTIPIDFPDRQNILARLREILEHRGKGTASG